jgi:serine/threonine protein kinase
MSLAPGTRLGAYDIIGPLGEGGMGEVYRARDPQLERELAIKILAPHLARDRDALARFEREARAASALNHPHIVHIYEIGEAETASGTARYIAMELVTGETLRRRMRRAPGSLDLVEPLVDVADALGKAHRAGIVHRDLKPENIMISADGYAKVLDFGLAKLTETPAAMDAATAAPGLRTEIGSIVGTAGYMAPEQVHGHAVDHRADVFSFGCVLYEVAAGRPAFKRDLSVATLHAIAYDEPTTIESLNPAVSPALTDIVRRCLAKQPAERYQSMTDVAADLRALVRHSSNASANAATVVGSTPSLLRRPLGQRRAVWLTAAGVVLFVVLGASWSMRNGRRTSEPPPQERIAPVERSVVPPPPPAAPDPRPSIAALEFQSPQVPSEFATLRVGIADAFTDAFARSGRFRVVERTQLDKAIKELDLGRSAHGDPATAQRVGQLIGAQYLIVGSFQIVSGQIRLNARLVRVETGEIVHAEAVTGKSADALQLPDRLVEQFLQALK